MQRLSRRHRTKQLSVRADVAGWQAPRLVIGGLIALTALTIAGALAADADGAGHPATVASILVAVIIVLGGPSAARRRPAQGGPSRRPVMTAARFDELIHASTRLPIVALLAAADWVQFAFIRDELGLSDSALSKHLSTLEQAGYIDIDRPLNGRRRRVQTRLTPTGRAAFHGHIAALREIVANADPENAFP